jgi:hypothetical protein
MDGGGEEIDVLVGVGWLFEVFAAGGRQRRRVPPLI